MPLTTVRYACALILLCVSVQASAGVNQWTSSGPDGGIVTDVAYDPTNASIAYASSNAAVYKTTDGGANWTVLMDDFGTSFIYDLMLDPSNHNRLYVAATGGIYRSSDAGATFTKISPTPTDPTVDGPYGIAISSDGATLYYSTLSGRFFRSTDSGQTWSERTAMGSATRDLIVNPGNANVIYASGQKFYKSSDGGDHWTATTPAIPATVSLLGLAFLPGAPSSVWVTTGGNVYKSIDEGANWTLSFAAPPGTSLSTLSVDPNASDALVAASVFDSGPLYTLSGVTWTPHGTTPTSSGRLAVAPGNSSVVLATSIKGLYRTSNLGTTWSSSSKGIHATTDRILANSGVRTYAGHEWITLGYSVNDGPWQEVSMSGIVPHPNPYFDSLAVHPTTPNTLLAGIQQNGVWRSIDGGVSWNQVPSIPAMARTYSIAFDPSNPNTIYTATTVSSPPPDAVIRKSTDGGVTFSPVSTGLTYPFPNKLAIDPMKSTRLFLSGGVDDGAVGLLRSVDSGANWSNVIGNVKVFDAAFDPADSKRMYAATEGGLRVSADGGDTWSVLTGLSPDTYGNPNHLAIDPTLGSNLYVVTAKFSGFQGEYFIMRSVDRGVSWERIPNKLSTFAPVQLTLNAFTANTVYVAFADRGVYTFEPALDQSARIDGHSGVKPLGVQSSFDARVQNVGPFSASDVKLTIQVPATSQNVGVTIDRGTCAVTTVAITCSVPFVHKDELISAHVTYTPVVAGAVDVRASVFAHERDLAAGNDVANATATAAEVVDLQLASSVLPIGVTVGDPASYSFQVTNAGPSVSSAGRVAIQMPSGVSITSVTPSSCVASGLSIDCNLGATNAAASSTIVVNVMTTATGTQQATAVATLANAAIDLNSANNSTSASLTVNAKPTSTGGGGGSGGGAIGGAFTLALGFLWLAGFRRRSAFTSR